MSALIIEGTVAAVVEVAPDVSVNITYTPQVGMIRLDFSKPVEWLVLTPDQAIGLARTLFFHATKKT